MTRTCFLLFILIIVACTSNAKAAPKKISKKKKKTELENTTTQVQTKLSAHNIEENNLFFEAERLKVLDENENAVAAFEKVLSFNSNNHAAMFELARLFYITKQDDKALKYIANAVKLMPNNLWYNLVYAQILAVKEDYKAASAIYDKIISIEPREESYYYDKASLLESSGDLNKALDYYNQIEHLFGIDPYCSEQKKNIYISQNKIEQASKELEKLIASDSTNPEYYNALASIYLVNKQNDKAVSIYNYILNKFPNNSNALLSLADISYQNGDKRQAIDYTSRAFKSNEVGIDNETKILYQYVRYYDSKKAEINDAFRLAEIVRTLHPSEAKAYAITADLYYVDNQDSIALTYYIKSTEYSKDVYGVWRQIMLISSRLNKIDLLKTYSEQAIELFPAQPLPYYFNGLCMYQLKRYRDAVNVLQEAYKYSKDDQPLKLQVLASLGDNYHEIGNHVVSDSCFEAALKLEPNNTYTLNNYAYYLSLRKDKLNRAKEYAAMAIKIDARNANYLDTYAWILFQLGEYVSAEEYQLKALQNSDLTDATLYDHYGDILYKNGKAEEAVKAWIKAKEKGAKSTMLDKKIADKLWYENEAP